MGSDFIKQYILSTTSTAATSFPGHCSTASQRPKPPHRASGSLPGRIFFTLVYMVTVVWNICREEADELAKKLKLRFYRTSVKEDLNVNDGKLATEACVQLSRRVISLPGKVSKEVCRRTLRILKPLFHPLLPTTRFIEKASVNWNEHKLVKQKLKKG